MQLMRSQNRGWITRTQKKQIRLRQAWVIVALAISFLVLTVRLVELQVIRGPEYARKAQGQHFKEVTVKPKRGVIRDRHGEILALDLKVSSIYANVSHITDLGEATRQLAPLLKMDRDQLTGMLQGPGGFKWLGRQLDPEMTEKIQFLDLPGIHSVMESRRFYPQGPLMGQLLGFTGVDHQGMEGVELQYNPLLRSQEGGIRFRQDASGRKVFPKDFEYADHPQGNELVLTVDRFLQHVSERELDAVVESTQAKSGSVLIMDPMTGEILAWAIQPSFNPNDLSGRKRGARDSSPNHWRNRVITDIYEPGSTFKVILTAAALQESLVTPDEMIDCTERGIHVAGGKIYDHEAHGILSFEDVVARSSNVGIIQVARRMEEEKFYQYIRAFGFGERTGVDLKGEVSGLLRDVSGWSRRSLPTLAIGQEIGVTALQMLSAVSSIANDGWLMRPYILKEVRDSEGQVIQKLSPQVRRRVLTPEVAAQTRTIMQKVTREGGTGVNAALEGYAVAGKTGTAQKYDSETGRYSSHKNVSSFVGMIPADKPRITILVIVDEPQSPSWASLVAAPVFKNIAQQAMVYLGVSAENSDQILVADALGS